MNKIYLLAILFFLSFSTSLYCCDCGSPYNQKTLDDKIYSGNNYVFYTAKILSVQSAFHLEVAVQIDKIYYGSKHIKDVTKPVTVYFDLRGECAIKQSGNITVGARLFITSAFNNMGRMLITNNCDAFFPVEDIAKYNLQEFLEDLKFVE